MDAGTKKHCILCRRGVGETPLLRFDYQDATYWICPQHLPVLIHDPSKLVGLLPGAERLRPAQHDD